MAFPRNNFFYTWCFQQVWFLPIENELKVQQVKVKDQQIQIIHQILQKENVEQLIEASMEVSYMISTENLVIAH